MVCLGRFGRLCATVLVLLCGTAWAPLCGLGQLCGSTLHYSFGQLSVRLLVGFEYRFVVPLCGSTWAVFLQHLGQLSLQVLGGFVYSFVVTLPEAAWAALCSTSGTT